MYISKCYDKGVKSHLLFYLPLDEDTQNEVQIFNNLIINGIKLSASPPT
jgi:hypothetical protein